MRDVALQLLAGVHEVGEHVWLDLAASPLDQALHLRQVAADPIEDVVGELRDLAAAQLAQPVDAVRDGSIAVTVAARHAIKTLTGGPAGDG